MSPNQGVLLGLMGRSEELLGLTGGSRNAPGAVTSWHLGLSRAVASVWMKAGGGKPQMPAAGLIHIYLEMTNTPVGKAKGAEGGLRGSDGVCFSRGFAARMLKQQLMNRRVSKSTFVS